MVRESSRVALVGSAQRCAEERHLEALRAHAPGQPRYLDLRREPGKVVSRWNLVVPDHVLSRAWAEVS